MIRYGNGQKVKYWIFDLESEIVFIKNIDNVVSDKLRGDTVTYKKILAGVLVTLQ